MSHDDKRQSSTPRTDAIAEMWTPEGERFADWRQTKYAELARQLERELAEVRLQLEKSIAREQEVEAKLSARPSLATLTEVRLTEQQLVDLYADACGVVTAAQEQALRELIGMLARRSPQAAQERIAAALHACEGIDTVDLAANEKGWMADVVQKAADEEVRHGKVATALRNLLKQVDDFCATEGEADFYTGEAVEALGGFAGHDVLDKRGRPVCEADCKKSECHVKGSCAFMAAPPSHTAAPADEHRITPFSNCRYEICDLPGQCVGEGKCHHPATVSAPSSMAEPDPVRHALANIVARFDNDEFIPTEYLEQARAALAGTTVLSARAATWIPVSERQPDFDGEVLVVTQAGKFVTTRPAKWVRALWNEITRGDDAVCAITHWMPLPSAPTDDGSDTK